MDYLLNKAENCLQKYTSLNGQVSNLKRKLEQLNSLKEDTQSRKLAELRPGKRLKKQVENWFGNVQRVNGEVQKLEEEIKSRSLVSRGLLREALLNKKEEVEELIQKGIFSDGLVVDESTGIGQMLPPTNVMGETIKQNMENVWELLMDEGVGQIGVHGMGGVGKTTIMKEINNQLLNRKDLFDIVVWVTVSKELNMFRLQNNIASRLGVDLSNEEDEAIRAGKLFETLAQKGRFVIILDDLWDKLSLHEVGIPEPANGSKLVITTRSLDICRYMNCEAIKVQPLVKEEAWNLFLEKVGRDILSCNNLELIAKSVANECAGLPLAIVIVASGMRGIYEPSEWKNALNELRRHIKSVNDIDGRVFQRLRFSYDRLNDEKIQSCFLWCALYPEDFHISKDKLIRYWNGDGLLNEMDSWKEKVDRGHAIINRLINNCLLENVGNKVKIHDVVRDMALRITKSRFLVKSGMQIRELPDVEEWPEELEKVSLMRNRISKITLSMPSSKSQMLTTLLLYRNEISWIPECLFEHTPSLRILDLSYNPIVSLPESICNLYNLKMLLLHLCKSLQNIPSLSKLQALEDLDLSNTRINLKFFDLRRESPNKRFQNLCRIQHLNVKANISPPIGKDIARLKRLGYFAGQFDDIHEFNAYVVECLDYQGHFPTVYNLLVVSKDAFYNFNFDVYGKKRCILIYGFDVGSDIQIIMPTNVVELYIRHCSIGKSLSDSIYWLKEATDPASASQELSGLLGTTAIPNSLQAVTGVFSSLKTINIFKCAKMKKLFSPTWLLHGLQRLEVIQVSYCSEMEEIIESDGEGDIIQFTLPSLRRLILKDLPELRSICCRGGVLVCHLLEVINIQTCTKLKRIPVSLPQADDGQRFSPLHLRRIIVWPQQWWESVEWDLPNAKHLLLPIVGFLNDGGDG